MKRLLIVGGAGTLFCAPGLRVVDGVAIPEEFWITWRVIELLVVAAIDRMSKDYELCMCHSDLPGCLMAES